MIKIILYVLSLVVLVTVAVWFADTPGRVSIDWMGWRVDTSVAILFALMAGILVIGTVLIRLWSTLISMGRKYQTARKDKRVNRGLDGLAVGVASIHGGDSTTAQKGLREAKASFGEHAVLRVLEQQATRLSGDAKRAASEARELLTEPVTELAALRDLTMAAKDVGDLDGALGYAKRALDRKTPPRWALTTALDLQIALNRWEEAATTLDRKDVISLFEPADLPRLKAAIYARAGSTALVDQDSAVAIKWARKALSADATRVDATVALARALAAETKTKKAATELEKAWRVNPHPSLLSAYLQLSPADSALAKAKRVETLVAGNQDHPESRLAVAETSLKADLWGAARSQLEPLLDKGTAPPTRARAAALLAQIDLGQHGDTKAATNSLVIALESKSAPVDSPEPTTAAELLSRTL